MSSYVVEQLFETKYSHSYRSSSSGNRAWLLNALPRCRIRRLLLILSFLDTLCTRVGISQGYNQGKQWWWNYFKNWYSVKFYFIQRYLDNSKASVSFKFWFIVLYFCNYVDHDKNRLNAVIGASLLSWTYVLRIRVVKRQVI